MLEQVLQHLNNWFLVSVNEGTYTIEDGGITLPFLVDGQYFRIIGSVFNDGLYQYGPKMECLTDETFDGVIWALAVPKSIVTLSEEMAAWETKNGAASSGPYQSESFGGYSYSKASGKSGGVMTVWDAFSSRLSAYKKPRELGYVQPSGRRTWPFSLPYNPDFPWR